MDFPTSPPVTSPPVAPRPRLAPRLLTALVGIPLVLLVVWLGGAAFRLLCLVLALGALRELQVALKRSDRLGGATLAGWVAYPAVWLSVWGGLTTGFPFALLGVLLALGVFSYGRGARLTLPELGLTLLATLYIALFALLPPLRNWHRGELFYLLLFGVWASDTAAYYGGRALGRKSLSSLSPGKTREGALIGAIAAIVAAILIAHWAEFSLFQGAIWGVIIAVCAPLGDLAESFWKRELGIKDLGTVFPGHGGILDRCDSILFAALGLSLYFQWLWP